MARFYKISIGPTWLTDDGESDGRPCKTVVEGISGLLVQTIGNVSVGNDSSVFREKVLISADFPGGGRVFTIMVPFMTGTTYGLIKAFLDDKAETDSDFNVTGEGTPGDFDVDAIVYDNDGPYISNDGFIDEHVKNVRISLITSKIN